MLLLCRTPLKPRGRTLRVRVGLFAGLLLLAPAPTYAAITGVCPDGSIFIVRNASQIPCKRAKQVDPGDIPPIRPEYLPTPYTWQVYNEAQDPNNPYNLIDAAKEVRALRGDGPLPAEEPRRQPRAAAPQAAQSAAPVDLGLADQELRDLYLIVELAQQQAPATLRRETADRRGVFELRFARSHAFSERLAEAWASRGGLGTHDVLLFTAVSKRPEAFHANFTVVQDHLSYQPVASNARQLGILQGRLGDLEADEVVLGYLVLPAEFDLSRSVDLYWNDRRLEVLF